MKHLREEEKALYKLDMEYTHPETGRRMRVYSRRKPDRITPALSILAIALALASILPIAAAIILILPALR